MISDNSFVDCNTATVKLLNAKSKHDILITHPSDLSPKKQPDGRESFEKANAMMDIAYKHGFHRFEWMHKKLSGEFFPVEVSLTVIEYNNKLMLYTLWKDLTKQKKFEKKIASIAKFPAENPNPILRISEDKIILYSNKAALNVFKTINILPNSTFNLWRSLINSAFNSNSVIKIDETQEGNSFFTWLLVPEKDEGYLNIYGTDITDLKKSEELLVQSQKFQTLGTFAGRMGHEFNNILGIIMGYADMLKYDDNLTLEQKKILGTIYKYGEKGAEVIDNTLKFSHKHKGKFNLIKLDTLLKDTITLIKILFSENVTILLNTCCEPSEIMGDEVKIQQVLMNICNNSMQAMDKFEPKITINLDVYHHNSLEHPELIFISGRYLKLSIEDNGCGMSNDTLSKISDPFFNTKQPGKGTGLGMPVVYTIIKEHRAHLTVKSKLTKGTIFCIYFPSINETTKYIDNKHTIEVPVRGNERILIVDDELDLLKIFAISLGKLGYRVTTTAKSTNALQVFRNNPDSFDLIISDYHMPKMNGGEFYTKVNIIKQNFPFILITGYKDVNITKFIKKNKKIKLLFKPLKISELTMVAKNLCKKVGANK